MKRSCSKHQINGDKIHLYDEEVDDNYYLCGVAYDESDDLVRNKKATCKNCLRVLNAKKYK